MMSVQRCKHGDVSIPDNISLPDLLLRKTAEHGTKIALIDAQTGKILTYRKVNQYIRQMACAMRMRGLRKGDVVMVFSPNHVLFPIVVLGVGYIGGITSLVNNNYTPDELRPMIEDTRPDYIFTVSRLLPVVQQATEGITEPKEFFVFDDSSKVTSVGQLLEEGDPHFISPVTITPREDILVLPFSSGTTGRSKGVMITHYNAVANVFIALHPDFCLGMTTHETHVCFLPLYHIYGLGVIVTPDLFKGHSIVVIEKFSLELYLQCIQKYKATLLHVVPPVALELAKNPIARNYDLSSVDSFYCGAAPLGEDVEREVLKSTGITNFKQGYGMTEASPNTHMAPMNGWKHGSCGLLLPNTECKVVDYETGRVLGPNENGELWIRGPQIMKGYWKRPKATRIAIDLDGFLHTGDIGHYDEEGNFYIVDRLKELIKWKGLQVAPADLEIVLLRHPAVADVAVIGIPDEAAGEVPRAYIVTNPGIPVTALDVITFVSDNVSPHKRLRGGVVFVSVIPKSPSGKILRRVLRERYRNPTANL